MAEAWDAIVIGGGAAGLMCAIEAGKRGRRVLVLEHNQQTQKFLILVVDCVPHPRVGLYNFSEFCGRQLSVCS